MVGPSPESSSSRARSALHPEPAAIDEHTATRLGLAAPRLVAQRSERSSEDEVLRLFDECAPALTRYVRACGLSADAADDVVQETFIALFSHVGLGRSRENLRAWLFTVAHRLALEQRERAARRRSVEIPWTATWRVPRATSPREPPGAGDPR